jgi:Uma2 family endonuclease
MDIKEMKERKKSLGMTNAQIAESSGVPLGTVQKVFSGATEHPRYDTLMAIERALQSGEHALRAGETAPDKANEEVPAAAKNKFEGIDWKAVTQVQEIAVDYDTAVSELEPETDGINNKWINRKHLYFTDVMDLPDQGSYTIEDYYDLPETVRAELIDGFLYNMASPSVKHQEILTGVLVQLYTCNEQNGAQCKVYAAPLDVRLDMDNKTMVQPDVLVICHDNDNEKRIEGAPELAIEILSQSNRSKDCVIKLNKYMSAGVKEYWIIDPENSVVLVYVFAKEGYPKHYSFGDKIPVYISGGKCEIDFSRFR